MNLAKIFAHDFERLSQTAFKGGLQLLLDRGAHLLELRVVVRLDRLEPAFERRAQRLEFVLAGVAQLRELAV